MHGRQHNEEEYGQELTQGNNHELKYDPKKLTYKQFKDFMINFGILTDIQSQSNCIENSLIFDMWEIIAPIVERDLTHLDKEPEDKEEKDCDISQIEDLGIDIKERSYRKEVRA